MAKKTANESILREKTVKTAKAKVQSDSRFKSLKSMSILSVVLVLAICIIGNLILSLTLDKPLTFDASSVKSNTVSKYTREYLDKLEKKVEIIGLFNRNDDTLNTEWREYFIPIIDDFEAKGNGKIEVSYIDPDVDPFILTQLDPNGLYGLRKYIYVVRCGENLVPVDPYACFTYDPQAYQLYGQMLPTTNNVEKEFTQDIVYVSSDRPLQAYYLDGHDLPSHGSLDEILKSLGFQCSTLNLRADTASIPVDCTLLVILEPKTDLSVAEKELIKSYLDNAGLVLLVCDYDTKSSVEYVNLNEVTKRMGVTLENGVIHEADVSYLPNQDNPYYSIAVADPDYASYISIPSNYIVESCRYLKIYGDRDENVYVSPLVTTSDLAYVDFANTQIDSSVTAMTYPVVLQCVDVSNSQPSCMIIVSTDSFTSDSYYALNSLSDENAVFMKTMLGDITPSTGSLIIPSKTVPSYVLSKPLSSSAATMWSVVVMTIIPVGCLICGVYIFRRRRHL